MADDAFSENSLTEKLTKLNCSQQSIESLSRWCISHHKKAKKIVETWQKLFKSVPKERRVSFLYLANDILQNSRRKCSEFVNEFWKVLPTALKGVYDNGEENCKKVASRLVNIWAERKVFGSKGQNLKNELLGKNPSRGKNPSPVNVGKNSNPIKVMKRDANYLRIKLTVGGAPEKILTAFQLVLDEIVNEEEALNKCRHAAFYLQDVENGVNVSSPGDLLDTDVASNIQKQESVLQHGISQLEKIEATRIALVSQLREALQDQESKLELIQSELLIGRGQIEQAANMKLRLTSISSTPPTANQVSVQPSLPPAQPTNNLTLAPPAHPVTSFANPTISEEETKRVTAAAVAAKLTASTSSAQMLSSVLSSLVAEEAALMSRALTLKRPKLDKPVLSNEANNPERANSLNFQSITSMPPVQLSAQSVSQLQAPFLPPPLAPPANQLVQSNVIGLPYGYGASNLPPFAEPGPSPQKAQPQQMQPNQQSQAPYYRPVGIGFYGQGHQPPTPPINNRHEAQRYGWTSLPGINPRR